VGGVCREWGAVNAGMAEQRVRRVSLDSRSVGFMTYGPTGTLCSAAVASPATARWAASCGLAICKKRKVQLIAGLHADTETLAVLRELGMPLSETVINAVALSGRLDILQHLLVEQQCPVTDELSNYAARSGSVPMLQWLRSRTQCLFGEITCEGAAEGGHLALLQQLSREGCGWDNECITHYAAVSGSIELVEWLRQQHDTVFNDEALASAAGAGQLAMCEHLLSIGCEWDEEACRQAVVHRSVDTLRWLRERGCPWDVNEVLQLAACNNLTAILEYVIEQGAVLLDAQQLTVALKCAGTYNRLQAAQLIRQHGAQWPAVLGYGTGTAPMAYAQPWHGETLVWARAQGCTAPVAQ
jgi:hypothetical protein